MAGALSVLALAACQRAREDPEAYAARNAVIRFNQRLVEAYRASRAELMSDVADADEVSRAAATISGLLSQGLYMEARQTSFQVERTSIARGEQRPVSAEMEVLETWEYEHRALGARDVPSPKKKVTYKLAYQLRKTDAGGWIVAEVIDREHPRPPRATTSGPGFGAHGSGH